MVFYLDTDEIHFGHVADGPYTGHGLFTDTGRSHVGGATRHWGWQRRLGRGR